MSIPIVIQEICEILKYPMGIFTTQFKSALEKFRSITKFILDTHKQYDALIDSFLFQISSVKESALLALETAQYIGNATESSFDMVKKILEDSGLDFEIET